MTPITTPEISANPRSEEGRGGASGERSLKIATPKQPLRRISNTRPQAGIVETEFAELAGGTLVELMEDPADANRMLLAVSKGGRVEYLDQFKDGDRVLVPFSRANGVLRTIRFPKGVSPYISVQALLMALENLISRCIGIKPEYIPVVADFVLSTWFVDRVSVAPYLSVAGLPQSGKTTLLSLLSLLCRRALLISDVTPASFYAACTQFIPTILIDEAATVGNNRQLRHMMRTGATRDVVAVRSKYTFHSYGAKVVSWLEPPDDSALNSRCILIPMFETTLTGLSKPNDPEVERTATALQAQLFQYRLENYSKVASAPIKGDEGLRPRSRDLLRALSAASLQDSQRSQARLWFFKSGNAVPLEPLTSEQNAVVLILFAFIHSAEKVSSLRTSDLTRNVNHCLRLSGEKVSLAPRKVGAVLTSLGFSNRTRGNSGWCVYFCPDDIKRIHQLAENYGIDGASQHLIESLIHRKFIPEECALCQAAVEKEIGYVPPIGESAPIDIVAEKR
jgi:hypothetical protein